MLFYKRLQVVIGSLLVIHHLMDTHLGECKLLALTFFGLQTADGIEHHLEVLLLLIELRQHAEHIRIAVILGIDSLVGIDGILVFSLADIVLGESLCKNQVLRILLYRLLQSQKTQRILLHLGQIERQIIICRSRVRIDVPGVFVEIEGGRIIASCMLASRLGQEVFISLTVVWRKRIHPYSLLLLSDRLHLLFPGERRQGYGTDEHHSHPDSHVS